jgi:hypothetical protein
VGGQHHAPAALPPGMTRYPLYKKLGGPQDRSGRVLKNLASNGIRSPDRPARSSVAIPTELSRPRLFISLLFLTLNRLFGEASAVSTVLYVAVLLVAVSTLFNCLNVFCGNVR